MAQPIVQVDAFTSRPFAGNPAAVCVLALQRDDEWMQNVAREMNLSETAFVLRETTADAWALRWFTPVAEVDLCGHATLATAHVLFEDGHAPLHAEIRFSTRSGTLTARSDGGRIVMDFPAMPPAAAPATPGLLEALGLDASIPTFIGRNASDWIVALADAEQVRALAPDFLRLAAIDARGVIVTAPGDATCDFVSRFFAPAVGVPEDPVTGSAHCCLAPFWAARLQRSELVGYQASARGGVVHVRHLGSRVLLTGDAVTVMRGELVGDG